MPYGSACNRLNRRSQQSGYHKPRQVHIRIRVRPDSETQHDQLITVVYKWQMITLICDKMSSVPQIDK